MRLLWLMRQMAAVSFAYCLDVAVWIKALAISQTSHATGTMLRLSCGARIDLDQTATLLMLVKRNHRAIRRVALYRSHSYLVNYRFNRWRMHSINASVCDATQQNYLRTATLDWHLPYNSLVQLKCLPKCMEMRVEMVKISCFADIFMSWPTLQCNICKVTASLVRYRTVIIHRME